MSSTARNPYKITSLGSDYSSLPLRFSLGASSTSGEETETNIVDSSAKNDEEIPSNTTVEEQKTTPQEAMETDEVSTSTEVTTDKDSSKPETEAKNENSVKITRNSVENDDEDDQPAAKRPRTEESN